LTRRGRCRHKLAGAEAKEVST